MLVLFPDDFAKILGYFAALYGLLALAADLGPGPTEQPARSLYEPYPKIIPAPDPLPRLSCKAEVDPTNWIKVESSAELRFTADGEHTKLNLMPLYQIRDQPYSV